MTHREKVERFLREMDRLGVSRSVTAPPLFRWLWKLGFEVRPVFFQGFAFYAICGVVGTVLMSVFWGTAMWFLQWRGRIPVSRAVTTALLMGVSWSICCTL